MKTPHVKITATYVGYPNGKREQETHKIHCTACGGALFDHFNQTKKGAVCRCIKCGRHLSIGILIMDAVS